MIIVYTALWIMVVHKQAIERHLRDRLGELFGLQYDLLLYDVTSTYFEGLAESNTLAARGYSRDHRPDCKQICIALVVTREGMPLGYEVFAGNRSDVTTVGDRHRHGSALRSGQPNLGDGPRYDQLGERRLAAADRTSVFDWYAQKRAAQVVAGDR